MAAILIDYENVNGAEALRGVDELTEQDILHIFYSDPCAHIRRCEMDAITGSRCRFFITKLLQPRKNALDFYIAAECGRLAEQGVRNIVIVSKDKGFTSVVDYFKAHGEKNPRVVTAPCVEAGLISVNDENVSRLHFLTGKNRLLKLEQEYLLYRQRCEIMENLKLAFLGTEYEASLDDIYHLVDQTEKASPKELYLESMHRFGIVQGRDIYRILKKAV